MKLVGSEGEPTLQFRLEGGLKNPPDPYVGKLVGSEGEPTIQAGRVG